MKILFYCDEYPPAKHGGIGSVVKIVAEALSNKGHEVSVVGNYEAPQNLEAFTVSNGVRIFRFFHFKHQSYIPKCFWRPLNFFLRKMGYLNKIAEKTLTLTEDFIQELIEKEKIDCYEILDHIRLTKYLNTEYIFKKYGCPTIIRVHGSPSFIAKNHGLHDRILLKNDSNNFLRCDYISAVSKYAAEYVKIDLECKNKIFRIIPNPIEKTFIAENPKIGCSNNIVFIGKITEKKGAFSILKSYNEIGTQYPSINLILIGGGDIDKAKKIVSSHLLDRVVFLGYLEREDIISHIDNSLFCVLPSYFETFGMVALEVMARGKALIFTSRASGKEIISSGLDGLLIDPENIEEITSNIAILINNKSLRDSLGVKALEKINKTYVIDQIIKSLISFYTFVASNK